VSPKVDRHRADRRYELDEALELAKSEKTAL
jgi:hypothetical protein